MAVNPKFVRLRSVRWVLFILLLLKMSTSTAAYMLPETLGTGPLSEQYEYDCFPASMKENLLPRFASRNQNDSIAIQVSRRYTHQVISRIYSIFLREILGYRNVKLVDLYERMHEIERERLFVTLENLVSDGTSWPEPTIDLEVWMLSDYHIIPPEIEEAGSITHPGRFGLFIPKPLIRKEDVFPKLYPYTMFQEDVNDVKYYELIKKFEVADSMLEVLKGWAEKRCRDNCDMDGMYVPEQCKQGRKCALVLAPHFEDTKFIVKHIDELKFQLKVIWLGGKIKLGINYLMKAYGEDRRGGKKFLVLHWTPSEVIDSKTMEYVSVTMPRCEEIVASNNTGCKYELTPLLKYHAHEFESSQHALQSLIRVYFDRHDIHALISLYDKYEEQILRARDETNLEYDEHAVPMYYNQIACEWLKTNEATWHQWKPRGEQKEDIYIGGIFPLSGLGKAYLGIMPAAVMAQQTINLNDTILPNHRLIILKSDGQCRADTVMKTFINYYIRKERMIGVLGPACSDTVEPIAGVSKHFRMAVISYSAEGAFLSDRETYPYFFRTIGENRQYEHVYARLLKQLNWNRVAALTEDGQKSTEYISHMESLLKENHIELISNKKFPRDRGEKEMNQYLLDLKTKNARIIIADVDDKVAQVIMCEAYKLEMTAENGYIWFLPVWLSHLWNHNQGNVSVQCTAQEMLRALNGHFSLSHAPFADNRVALETSNATVGEWRTEYRKILQSHDLLESDYAGYAYDAVWVYALALDKLIREDPSYLSDLHSMKTTKRLMEVIRATDFQGVSGRIRFGEEGSRYTYVNVLQWINGTPTIVGQFTPNISDEHYQLLGGSLTLNLSSIVWFTKDGKIPDDGALDCNLAGLARFFGTNCDGAVLIFTGFMCVVVIAVISLASFCFFQIRYDRKMKSSAKYLQKFGIDLLSPSSIPVNTLDKWEIPKDRVVINRRLGEGAFGTVYGGEAQIDGDGWTAVAVKTLKIGSTTEDKVDFLSEAEAMKRFDHNNIVKLLGVCLQTEPVYTVMEFMLYGDLKTYLLARRHLVNNKTSEDSDISPKRLTMMALDISRALSYLAEQKYVHRDVACRNCMVNAQRMVKLGDFGMARPTFENDYYRFNRKGMLPVRWMAPESLALGFFTPASDVWSYGILLYEIITFGSFPFQGMTNNQVLEHIKKGHSVTIPTGVKPQLEGLMKACWNQDYKKRPMASEVCEFISNYPRLLNPCLDVPLASVQMAESDSDQFELLPGLRKRKDEPTADLLVGTSQMNDLNQTTSEYTGMNMRRGINLNDLNVNTDFCSRSNTLPTGESTGNNIPVIANVYNPIEPLLQRDTEMSKSSNSLLRYVPMFGFGKNRAPVLVTHSNGSVTIGNKSTIHHSTSVL
uniref:Gamma-aminobutyric acid type B receptor subunit 2 n=4 Tax=Culex pipiens TaxID=7175 RepID=A0A8D8NPL4_CULPI